MCRAADVRFDFLDSAVKVRNPAGQVILHALHPFFLLGVMDGAKLYIIALDDT
jgi:hypothetical protein